MRMSDWGSDVCSSDLGGHATFNPEPFAAFVDFVVLGDGEEAVGEITEVVGRWSAGERTAETRQDALRQLAGIEGVYVPSLYEATYNPDGTLEGTRPIDRPDERRGRKEGGRTGT